MLGIRLTGVGLLVMGGLVATQSAAAGSYQLQPIRTDYAQTLSEASLSLSYESFSDLELDEIEAFDGWTAALELVFPFKEKFQLRLALPFHTEGDAVVKEDHWFSPGMEIDVEGDGGVFEFSTLVFEHQLFKEQEDGYNLSYYVGGGAVANPLETTLPRARTGYDYINHQGTVFLAGIKYDAERWGGRVLGNAGVRSYTRSDDLYPGNNDQFFILDLKTAMIFSPWGNRVYPVLEFTYLGDFSDMNQVTLLPELIVPVNQHLELKAGAALGLGGNGSESGAHAEMTVRF